MPDNDAVDRGMRGDTLEAVARCAAAEGNEGQAGDQLQAGEASTGRAATAAAEVEPDRPQPPQTLRAFERALRSLGYTQRQAAAIARDGFKAATPEPDADPLHELRAALERRGAALKGTSWT